VLQKVARALMNSHRMFLFSNRLFLDMNIEMLLQKNDD